MTDRVARMADLLSAMGIQRWQSRAKWVAPSTAPVAQMPRAHAKAVDRASTARDMAPLMTKPTTKPTRVPPVPSVDASQPEAPAAGESAFNPVALSMWRTARSLIFAPCEQSFPARFLNDLKRAVDGLHQEDPLVELPAFLWPPEGSRGLARTASMVSALRALIQREDKKRPLHFVLMFGDSGELPLAELVSSLSSWSNPEGSSQVSDGNQRTIRSVELPSLAQFLADTDSKRVLWQRLRDTQ